MNWQRLFAILLKEFRQMRRDKLTFAMMVGVPIMQLVLFGFAINSDPKHLPYAAVVQDNSEFSRSLLAVLNNSQYFSLTEQTNSLARSDELLEKGIVQFVLVIPTDFSRRLIRGERPALLLAADATDPAATGGAMNAFNSVANLAIDRELNGALSSMRSAPPPFEVRVQRRFNPEGLSRYNVVPGLIGVILTMTMIMMTALAMTRETERGTMENLLATPARPIEVMLGKILPYIIVGYVQVSVVLLAARLAFDVPVVGSVALLAVALVVFIAANLAIGFTFSTIARNQLQAMQLTFFFFLPSLLLSGFMFPFRGMPIWAQNIGQLFPLTHFLRLVRGILLKGNGLNEVGQHLWPIGLFLLVCGAVALSRYRQTLD